MCTWEVSLWTEWPWTKPGYITMTRKQSNNQWSGGIVAHPALKYSEYKNPLEKFSPQFFLGSSCHPPHWLSSKGPNYQRGVLLISACAIEGHSEGKTPAAERSPRGSCSCTTMPRITGHCLDHSPYSPDLAPSDYHLFPGLKKQLKVRHFSSGTEVIAAAETWLDGQYSGVFFEWLAEVQQRTKKCIALRGEYDE